jgi:hypothetical protein
LSVVAGDVVQKAAFQLVTAVQDASDAAFNDTRSKSATGNDTDAFIAAHEVNDNGTEVLLRRQRNTVPFAYTAGRTRLTSWFESMTAKSLSNH